MILFNTLVSFLLCFYIAPLNGMGLDEYFSGAGDELVISRDHVIEAMMAVDQAYEKGIRGFEGCKNKDKCGHYGFYLATYSPEGFCDDCEFKQYPHRYVACLFCRMPRKSFSKETTSSSNCLECAANIKKLLVNKLKKNDDWKEKCTLEIGASSALKRAESIFSGKIIPAFIKYTIKDQFLHYDKPYIYRGYVPEKNGDKLHIWVEEFNLDPEDKKETTWDDSENYVMSICKKYNIFGPETGEFLLDKIPENTVATYLEVINQ